MEFTLSGPIENKSASIQVWLGNKHAPWTRPTFQKQAII